MSGFTFDSTKKESEEDLGGGDRPQGPGRFHTIVKNAEAKEFPPKGDKEGYKKWIVDFEVVAGTLPGQEGRVHQEHYFLTAAAVDKAMRLAFMGDLLKPGEKKELFAAQLVGKQLVIELVERKYKDDDGKEKTVLGIPWPDKKGSMGVWRVGDGEVAAVPKNEQALNHQASNGTTTTSAPTTQSNPGQQPAASSWDDV